MSQPFIITDRDANIVTITMNDPETRNALSRSEQCLEFIEALEAVNRERDVSVVVLTGAGSAFCAGGNIKDMQSKQGLMAGTPSEIVSAIGIPSRSWPAPSTAWRCLPSLP